MGLVISDYAVNSENTGCTIYDHPDMYDRAVENSKE